MAEPEALTLTNKCTAHSSRTGQPCQKWAIKGATVCRTHGGSAPQVKAAADRRLMKMVSPMLARLNQLALQTDNLKVAREAVTDALDRAGIGEVVKAKVRASHRQDQGAAKVQVVIGFLNQSAAPPIEATTVEVAPVNAVTVLSGDVMSHGTQALSRTEDGESS